jgi:menaquinone-dependent protoporphyrinogen oxidase
VLVSAASRHGSTAEIARAIGEALAAAGLDAVVLPPDDVATLDGLDAVVLGSGIYMGHWMDAAMDLAERHAGELAARPVWLFSSGPIGDPPASAEDPTGLDELLELTRAREHRIFAGKVDRAVLGLGESVIVAAERTPEGYFRRWDDVRAWADDIAAALKARPETTGT